MTIKSMNKKLKKCVRSGIRTHAWRTRLRPERSALDRSAILTSAIKGLYSQNDTAAEGMNMNKGEYGDGKISLVLATIAKVKSWKKILTSKI
jgi:hypothetical protein